MDARDRDAIERRIGRLERSSRRWRGAAAAAVVGAALAAVGGASSQEGAGAADPGDPEALYQELHRTGDRAMALVERSLRLGAFVTDAPTVVATWSLRILEAELYRRPMADGRRTTDPEVYLTRETGPPDPAAVAAFRTHRDRLKRWEDRFRPLARDGTLSELDFLELQARRIAAEAWLARERNKPARPAERP